MGERLISTAYKYQAFISYSHEDEQAATRLQRELENFPIPKALQTEGLRRISPTFRDVTELTAHHSLSAKIEEAVQHSRYLVVLCSPAAKASHWVNEEIRLFRKLHGESAILCALIDGTPGLSFPEALTEGGREPLAADMAGQKESFKFGITQIAASILGVGLDDLVRRQARRRRIRTGIISGASLAFAAVMGVMAWAAIDARNAAETSRAESEKMVEYILTDIKDDLDEVGHLEIINKVGVRVESYYNAIPLSDMDDERLARQARTWHLLGGVALEQGNYDKALTDFSQAYDVTSELMLRHPGKEFSILSHIESELGLFDVYAFQNQQNLALPFGKSQLKHSQVLYERNPLNREYALGQAYALNALGRFYFESKEYSSAEEYFLKSLEVLKLALESLPDDDDLITEFIASGSNLGVVYLRQNNIEGSVLKFSDQINTLKALIIKEPKNKQYSQQLLIAQGWLHNINITKLKICKVSEINELILGLEGAIDFDGSNQSWQKDYITAVYDVLKNCPDNFEQKWQHQKLENAILISNSITEKSAILKDKVTWLNEFQAR